MFKAAGNCLRKVSYPTWDDGIHSDRKLVAKGFLSVGEEWHTQRQETVCERFPVRRGKEGIHADRKLFAKGFLSDVGRRVYKATGNCLRIVSYPTWEGWYSCRQETGGERFPIRRGTDCIHGGRKLFAKGFLHGMGRVVYIVTGNYSRRVSYPMWDECKS